MFDKSRFITSGRPARAAGTLVLLIGAGAGVFKLVAQAPPAAGDGGPSSALSQSVRPFLERSCIRCHNTGLPSGQVDMQKLLASTTSLLDDRDTWDNIAFRMRSDQMPPPGTPRPPRTEVDATVATITRALAANPRPTSAPPVLSKGPFTKDWATYAYDEERTGWARGETQITKDNVSKLQLLWKLQTDVKTDPINKYATMTDPLVINNVQTKQGPKKVLYVGGGTNEQNRIFAIDANAGTILWSKDYPNKATPAVAAYGFCPNNMNATPVIDKQSGILYFLPTDGKLRGVSITDGEDRFPATSIVPTFTRNFSLNLVDGVIYTGTTRGCQNATSQIAGIDVADPGHLVTHFYTSHGKGSGPWGRAGLTKTPFGVVAQTADGAYDPASGRWGNSVVELDRNVSVVDSFAPPNMDELNKWDLDLGSSSPVSFPFDDRTLVASTAKEGVIYLMDAKNLGGPDHRTSLYTSPRWSNDPVLYGYNGMWSVMSTWVDEKGKRWLLAPYYGPSAKDTIGLFPKTHGPTVNGQLMAFTVEGTGAKPMLVPRWVSADLDLPGVAVVANGVILILANGDRGANLVPGGGGRGGGRGGFGPAADASDGPEAATAALAAPGRGARGGGGGGGGFVGGRGGLGAARGSGAVGGRGGGRGRGGSPLEASIPGNERDAAWRAINTQKAGQRYSGGRETTHAVLYALDPQTGDELYSSGDAIDSWSHYGSIAVSDGVVYLSSWDARIYALGIKK
ncbi:MAG TPA: hypothetical protein VNY05_38895 [Candidatus Acidoferrales bacterium]|jgi:hypothetical protein|nr:hypothetical protein [Candidatus Acidoferrales bacterium]